MSNPRIKSVSSSVALGLLTVLLGSAQTNAQTSSDGSTSLDPPEVVTADAIFVPSHHSGNGAMQSQLGSTFFTAFCTIRGHGPHVPFNCSIPGVGINSNVFLAISEFGADATNSRFIGAARMTVHNVSPRNGGVTAWFEVDWPNDLNIRVDVLAFP